MPFSEPQSSRYHCVAALDQQRVVARDGHVVEEHLGVRAAADAHALALTGKLSPTRPPPARITSAGPCAVTSLDLDRHQLARLVDPVGRGHRLRHAVPSARGSSAPQRWQ